MVVLAFLTDSEVVARILHHLELPIMVPAVAPARGSGEAVGFALAGMEAHPSAENGNSGISEPWVPASRPQP
jgi:hypothetical protein